jgi:hypothetical protein
VAAVAVLAVGFSHDYFGFVVQTFDHAAGELLWGLEAVGQQRAVSAQCTGDFLHRLDSVARCLLAPEVQQ